MNPILDLYDQINQIMRNSQSVRKNNNVDSTIFECSWKSKIVSIIINVWMFLLAVSFVTSDLPGTTKMISSLWCSFITSHLQAYNVLTLLQLFVSKFRLKSIRFFGSKTRDLQAFGTSLKKKELQSIKWKSKLCNYHKLPLISSPTYKHPWLLNRLP